MPRPASNYDSDFRQNAEIRRLHKEVEYLKRQREILKKQ